MFRSLLPAARYGSSVVALLGLLGAAPAHAQPTFEVVSNLWNAFKGNGAASGVIQGSDGALYGVTFGGGPLGGEQGKGTVYRVDPDGTTTLLHEFLGLPNEIYGPPVGQLVEGADGNFYGLAYGGNADSWSPCGAGVVFRMTPAGGLSVVHAFANSGGAYPEGNVGHTGGSVGTSCQGTLAVGTHALTLAPDGSLYGAAFGGGIYGGGTLFKVTQAGEFSVVHQVVGAGGPTGLTLGSDGDFYGVMQLGGVLFKVTPEGVLTHLHNFNEPGGGYVVAPPVEGPDGNFYGFTYPTFGCGTFYRLTPSGDYTRVMSLPVGSSGCPAGGNYMWTALRLGTDGSFYTVASNGGGTSGYGTVIRITPAGDLTVLHTFSNSGGDGYYPRGRLLETLPGVFYGTTTGFGSTEVFRVTVPSADLAIEQQDAPDPVTVGSNVTYMITVTNNGPSPATDVIMTDTLPGTGTFVSATPSQGTCGVTTTVTCSLGSLLNGASATVAIVITPTATGMVSNTSSVAAHEFDPNSSNNSATETTTVAAPSTTLSALSPAKLWIGQGGTGKQLKFDLLAEVLVNGTVVGSGQLANVSAGGSNFGSAVLDTITLALGGAVSVPAGSSLSLRASVRVSCSVRKAGISGIARLWYDGQPIDAGKPGARDAGSRFGATVGGATSNYFLRAAFALAATSGSSRQSVDVAVSDAVACPARPFTPLGTWSLTLQ